MLNQSAIFKRHIVDKWSHRYNLVGVNHGVAEVVVRLDMLKVDSFINPAVLKNLTNVARHIRVVLNPLTVALKVPVINRIEANQGGKQADIRFGQLITTPSFGRRLTGSRGS